MSKSTIYLYNCLSTKTATKRYNEMSIFNIKSILAYILQREDPPKSELAAEYLIGLYILKKKFDK